MGKWIELTDRQDTKISISVDKISAIYNTGKACVFISGAVFGDGKSFFYTEESYDEVKKMIADAELPAIECEEI